MSQGVDFLNDRIVPLLYKAGVPMMLVSLLGMTNQVLNTFFIGHSEKEALLIVSLYLPFSFFMIALFESLQMTNQISIAIASGQQNRERAVRLPAEFLWISFGLGLVVIGLIAAGQPFILDYFEVREEMRSSFATYLMAMMGVNLIVTLNIITASAFRGFGRMKTTVVLSALGASLDILLVWYFALVRELGAMSIVYANLISSCIALAIGLFLLRKRELIVFERAMFRISSETKNRLRMIGFPVFLSYLLIFVSTFFYTKILSPFGEDVISGFNVAYRLQTLLILPALAMGAAIGIIMNYNLAAARQDRAVRTMVVGFINIAAIYAVLAALTYLGRDCLAATLVEDAAVRAQASAYLEIVAPSYVCMGPMLALLVVLEQLRKGGRALVMNAAYFLVIIAAGGWLTSWHADLLWLYRVILMLNAAGVVWLLAEAFRLKRELTSMGGKAPAVGDAMEDGVQS